VTNHTGWKLAFTGPGHSFVAKRDELDRTAL